MSKYGLLVSLVLLAALGGSAVAGEAPLSLAWQRAGGSELLRLDGQRLISREPLPDTLQAPLGSLWKLFVYAYLVDTGHRRLAYIAALADASTNVARHRGFSERAVELPLVGQESGPADKPSQRVRFHQGIVFA